MRPVCGAQAGKLAGVEWGTRGCGCSCSSDVSLSLSLWSPAPKHGLHDSVSDKLLPLLLPFFPLLSTLFSRLLFRCPSTGAGYGAAPGAGASDGDGDSDQKAAAPAVEPRGRGPGGVGGGLGG
ncbi:hypothetical protein M758_N017900 [Ceratodon purpureus]|nr:hypothetical protein M758_N017900 [Ceratodon purpureus]